MRERVDDILYRAVMPRGACIGFPRLYEGDESNAPGDHLPTLYATFYDTESIMRLAATRGYGEEAN